MTKKLRYDKYGFILAIFICCVPVCQISEAAETVLNSSPSNHSTLSIIDSIPQPDAGFRNLIGVHHDTSFAVLIETDFGIDTEDPDCVRFLISDGDFEPYLRNPSHHAVRLIEAESGSPGTHLLWAVYDRSLDPALPPFYPLDAIVKIEVSVADLSGHRISGRIFSFRVESDTEQANGFDNIPASRFVVAENSERFFDAGVEIIDGTLAGARILYDSREPLAPDFGPIDEIAPFIDANGESVATPLNLVPHTIFNRPVKLYIPYPEEADIEALEIYYHNGARWLPACDAAGMVLPGGEGWMVPGSRVNHAAQDPPTVEIAVYHFSAAQVVVSGSSTTSDGIEREHHGSGATVVASCFIDAAGAEGTASLGSLWGLLSLLGLIGIGIRYGVKGIG